MKYKDCNCLVIHLEKSVERMPLINNLLSNFNGKIKKIMKGVDKTMINKPFFKSLKNFKRIPSLNENSLFGRVGCFLSHLKCLNFIIENKLTNVIIFEDDAIIQDNSFLNKEIDNKLEMIYLGHRIYTGNKTPQVTLTHSIYYRDYKVAEKILNYALNNQKTWRAFDLFLSKEILPTVQYALFSYIVQSSTETGSDIDTKYNNRYKEYYDNSFSYKHFYSPKK